MCWHRRQVPHFYSSEFVGPPNVDFASRSRSLIMVADQMFTAIHGIQQSEAVSLAFSHHNVNSLCAMLTVCEGCGSLLAGYYVCVGIPGTPTAQPTTTSAGATPGPSPTQSGLVSNCKSFSAGSEASSLHSQRQGTLQGQRRRSMWHYCQFIWHILAR